MPYLEKEKELLTREWDSGNAFGTGMAFKVPEPALLKLEILDTSKAVREKIAWKNAAKMLGIRSL